MSTTFHTKHTGKKLSLSLLLLLNYNFQRQESQNANFLPNDGLDLHTNPPLVSGEHQDIKHDETTGLMRTHSRMCQALCRNFQLWIRRNRLFGVNRKESDNSQLLRYHQFIQ